MQFEYSEELWLHRHYQVSLAELAELAGVAEADLRDWVEEGIIAPIDPTATPWCFGADRLVTIRQVCRLRRDFELEPQGLALVMQLLDRIQSLESQVRELQAQLPRVFR